MDVSTSEKHPNAKMKDAHNSTTLPLPATYIKESQRRRRNRRCRVAVITCCSVISAIIIALGLIVLGYWLTEDPKQPNYDLADADLNLFSLTQVGTQYQLDADIDVTIDFGNPNKKMKFDIKDIDVHALYAGEDLGEVALPPFQQPPRNDTLVATTVRITNYVLSETVCGALQGEVAKSNITLQVEMDAKVRNNHGMFEKLHPFKGVQLTCSVNFMAPEVNGTAPGKMISKSCAVKR